jgi:dihydrofolate reductase
VTFVSSCLCGETCALKSYALILSFIVAVDQNFAIGKNGDLPWRLPDDLKFFKRTTMGKPMLMGRKTFESLRGILPGRLHIVVSSQNLSLPEGVLHYTSLDAAIERLKEEGTDEGFIIGGGEIFRQTLEKANRLYLTRVHALVEDADAFFPEVDFSLWNLVWEEEHPADEKHAFPFTFQQWDRK